MADPLTTRLACCRTVCEWTSNHWRWLELLLLAGVSSPTHDSIQIYSKFTTNLHQIC
jgi:hypothetical protein